MTLGGFQLSKGCALDAFFHRSMLRQAPLDDGNDLSDALREMQSSFKGTIENNRDYLFEVLD
ncbi:hypothetical protein ACFSJU_05720 [Paradesertivirga mongoliensis]|uniref:Uncharacterized protein n=1 Tax=Paradesertivirga mongoliensis TaxID=2100740 RepID=A0ABW4ZIM8_9SPHI|nr:hypothetical protein [Pedobacter mongoliensis]